MEELHGKNLHGTSKHNTWFQLVLSGLHRRSVNYWVATRRKISSIPWLLSHLKRLQDSSKHTDNQNLLNCISAEIHISLMCLTSNRNCTQRTARLCRMGNSASVIDVQGISSSWTISKSPLPQKLDLATNMPGKARFQ